jgi:hypothetical protein
LRRERHQNLGCLLPITLSPLRATLQGKRHRATIAKRFSALAPLGSADQAEIGLLIGAKQKCSALPIEACS